MQILKKPLKKRKTNNSCVKGCLQKYDDDVYCEYHCTNFCWSDSNSCKTK